MDRLRAIVTSINQIPIAARTVREWALMFDGQIGNAATRIQFIGAIKASVGHADRHADIDHRIFSALPSGTTRSIRTIGKPITQLSTDEIGVLALPTNGGQLS